MKYYHASLKHWKVGDIITASTNKYSGGMGIYVTTAPEPHFTSYTNGKNTIAPGMRVYRVRPLGKVKKGDWEDLVCQIGVEVVESLGEVAHSGKVSSVNKDFSPNVYTKNQVGGKPRYFVGRNYGISFSGSMAWNQPIKERGFKHLRDAQEYLRKINHPAAGIFDRKKRDWVEKEEKSL